jgi:hypothetical protein
MGIELAKMAVISSTKNSISMAFESLPGAADRPKKRSNKIFMTMSPTSRLALWSLALAGFLSSPVVYGREELLSSGATTSAATSFGEDVVVPQSSSTQQQRQFDALETTANGGDDPEHQRRELWDIWSLMLMCTSALLFRPVETVAGTVDLGGRSRSTVSCGVAFVVVVDVIPVVFVVIVVLLLLYLTPRPMRRPILQHSRRVPG